VLWCLQASALGLAAQISELVLELSAKVPAIKDTIYGQRSERAFAFQLSARAKAELEAKARLPPVAPTLQPTSSLMRCRVRCVQIGRLVDELCDVLSGWQEEYPLPRGWDCLTPEVLLAKKADILGGELPWKCVPSPRLCALHGSGLH